MRKPLAILFFLLLSCAVCAFSEEIEIASRVISVDPEFEFFIISSGETAGIEIGDGLIVHRGGDKVAEAYIIEVRPAVSAAEIIDIEEDEVIQEGDSILIVKKTRPSFAAGKKSKWAALGAPGLAASTDMTIEAAAEAEYSYIAGPSILEKGDVASIRIDADPDTVFAYIRLVLKENGYSITSSSRATGTMLATKPIELSLLKELLADAFAAIDHNLVVSLDVKEEDDYSKLMVSSFKEHSQKGKHVKSAVTRYSKYYNELLELASMIKERSEY